MSVYKKMMVFGSRYISKATLFKYGFNLSPMYRRSTGRVRYVSKDLHEIRIEIPLSWKNRNYVNSMFGGSLFAAVDPIPMIQLMNVLGDDFVVWDKSAEIFFKKPVRTNVSAQFVFSFDEIATIKKRIETEKEITVDKLIQIKSIATGELCCEVVKTIYVADKRFYKEKAKLRKSMNT